MPGGSSCLLGSVNLSNFVNDAFTDEAYIDFDRLSEAVRIGIIGLNEVLHEGFDLHPLEKQRQMARDFRQIGLGAFALGDLFIKLGITYGSKESLEVSHKLGKVLRDVSIRTSIDLVGKYGVYPKFDIDSVKESSYFKSLPIQLQNKIEDKGMANSHTTSIAPTGSVSTLLGAGAGGLEPVFSISFTRTTKSLFGGGDVDYKVYTQVVSDLMEVKGIDNEDGLPEYCITSHDIRPIDRVKLQGVWQEYIDSAISSTVNLKEDTTVEEIEDIFINSYKYGLKGVTTFRNNSFRMGILNTDKEDTKKDDPEKENTTQDENELNCNT